MRHCMENPAVQGGVRRRLPERLDTPEFTKTVSTAQDLAGPRFGHMVECLHRLGPRPLAETIVEIATVTGELTIVAWNLSRDGRSGRALKFDGEKKFPRPR